MSHLAVVLAQKRKGFGWERWSRPWLYDTLGLFNGYQVRRDRLKVFESGHVIGRGLDAQDESELVIDLGWPMARSCPTAAVRIRDRLNWVENGDSHRSLSRSSYSQMMSLRGLSDCCANEGASVIFCDSAAGCRKVVRARPL